MKKTLLLASLLTAGFCAQADTLEDIYFTGPNPTLDKNEKKALEIAQKWQASQGSTMLSATNGKAGQVTFAFGAQHPSIVCAVLQVCDIALQAGEQINSINAGDSQRWEFTPAISGTGANETQHIMIKPLDVGLNTSLVVATDRRVYHLRLRSHRDEYMHSIGFTYPEEQLAKFNALRTKQAVQKKVNTIDETSEYLGDLNFDYTIEGQAPWKPVRVYNNGVKTIVQLPKDTKNGSAPTLLVVRDEGGFFSDEELEIVNYRLQGDRYIVDNIFDHAILISGVGDEQERVTIKKAGK